RAVIAVASIIACAGVVAPSSVSAAATRPSVQVSALSCVAISQSADKAAAGSLVDLKVTMSPYAATLTGVIKRNMTQTIIHPTSVSITDGARAVGTSSLL